MTLRAAYFLDCLPGYCGFAFFPAVPWKAVVVPKFVPNPESLAKVGFFEVEFAIGGNDRFFGGVLAVLLAFGALHYTRNKTKHFLLVVQVFFDILSFPLIKTLASVMACTSNTKWVSEPAPVHRFCQDSGVNFPDSTNEAIESDPQCMDNNPGVSCWHGESKRNPLVQLPTSCGTAGH